MTCKIEFSSNGKINSVLDKKGNPSSVFKALFNTPVLTLEQTIEAFKNTYAKNSEEEVTFTSTSGEVFNTYQEALKDSTQGDISVLLGKTVVARVSADTSINTFEGTVNHLVKQGVLTGERILDTNGDQIFVVKGQTETAKHLTANIVEEVAARSLGQSGVKRTSNGNVILTNNVNVREISGTRVTEQELSEMTYDQLKDKFGEDNAISIELEREVNKNLKPSDSLRRIEDEVEVKTEDQLVESIKTLLNQMGVKIMSIEDYLKNNKLRNSGVPATASALMDVVNKIMAFKNGEIVRGDFIEEAMHLIEATLDPKVTEGIRKSIHKTAEWAQHAEYYYTLYSKEYSGDKLDEMVRREILGKVMANGVANNFQLAENATLTQKSIFDRIVAFLEDFFSTITNFVSPTVQSKIDALNTDIYNKLMNEELSNELSAERDFGTKFRLYAANNSVADELYKVQAQAEKALVALESQVYQIGANDASQRQIFNQSKEAAVRAKAKIEEVNNATNVGQQELLRKEASSELAATFAFINNVVQKQIKYLDRAVKKNENESHHFSSEELSVYTTLLSQFDNHVLPAIKLTLEGKANLLPVEKRLLEETKNTISQITDLKGKVGTLNRDSNEILADLLSSRLNLSQEKKDYLKAQILNQQHETNWFFMNFGTLMHSSNIFLNAAGHVVTKTYFEKRRDTLLQSQPFIKKLADAGYLGTKAKELVKDGYIVNRFDDKAREKALVAKKYEIYSKYSTNVRTLEEFENDANYNDVTEEDIENIKNELQDWTLENLTLSTLNPEAIREKKARLAVFSKVTQDYERNSSSAYNEIMQNAEVVNGIPTFTEDMKQDFQELKKQRAYDQSIFDRDGSLKRGIELRTEEEWEKSPKTIKVVGGVDVAHETNIVKSANGLYVEINPKADSSAVLAFELTKIANERIADMKAKNDNKEFPQKFTDMLKSMPVDRAYDFLMLNAYVGYSNDYYDKLERPTIIDSLQAAMPDAEDPQEVQDLIDNISAASKKRSVILQANKMMNNPSEVNYDNMDKNSEVGAVKELSEDLERYYAEANKLIEREETDEDDVSETIPNKAFRNYLMDLKSISDLDANPNFLDQDDLERIDDIFDVIYDHTTKNNKSRVYDLRKFVEAFSKGRRTNISKGNQKVFSKTVDEYALMNEDEIFASMTSDLLKYSYTKMLPYFRKTQPTGVDLALEELEAGILSPSDFMDNYLNDQYESLKITPNYNFQEATQDNNKNEHFDKAKLNNTPKYRTFEPGVTLSDIQGKTADQLKASGKINQFVNTDFLNEHGIDLEHLFNTGEEKATRNLEKFTAREAFVDLQKQTLVNYGKIDSHNIYLLPQKERGGFRKLEELGKNGNNLKNILDELINFREDEASLGQDVDGSASTSLGSVSIPKLGLRTRKGVEATDEILQSYIWMNSESNLYKARVKNIGDMLAIKEALTNSKFNDNLEVQTTNVYKMFEDNMRYNFYGIKEVFSKQFELFGVKGDLGQVLKSFGSLIRFRNLGFNLTIPATSALSGSVQLRIEKYVGERVDAGGLARANKIFTKTAGAASREVLGLKNQSWLNAMGARWGWFEYEDRFENSNYGKTVRGLGSMAYGAHTLGNFPVNPRVGLAVLADHRFVDGKIVQYREFKNDYKGKTTKEIRQIWEKYTDITQVSTVEEDGVVTYDYDAIRTAMESQQSDEELKAFMDHNEGLVYARVKAAIQAVDQQIAPEDKSIASRNAIFNFVTIHKGWFYLATQARFKKRQLSTVTGNFEEGSWTGAFRVVNGIVKDIRSGKAKNFVEYVKDRWANGDDTTRKNLSRTVTEMAVLNTLIAVMVLGMKEMDDDDEDSYLFKLSNMFLMRTTNEIASASVALPKNIYDTLGNMVVGLNNIDIAFEAPDLFSSDMVKRGKYKGLNERQRYFMKYLPMLKEYSNLSNIDETIKSYNYFNFEDNSNGGGSLKYWTLFPFLKTDDKK